MADRSFPQACSAILTSLSDLKPPFYSISTPGHTSQSLKRSRDLVPTSNFYTPTPEHQVPISKYQHQTLNLPTHHTNTIYNPNLISDQPSAPKGELASDVPSTYPQSPASNQPQNPAPLHIPLSTFYSSLVTHYSLLITRYSSLPLILFQPSPASRHSSPWAHSGCSTSPEAPAHVPNQANVHRKSPGTLQRCPLE